jgi:hypothetical protein
MSATVRARRTAAAAIAAGVLMATACGSSSETQTLPGPSSVKCGVEVAAETVAFPPSGGSATLRVTTNRECVWTAGSDATWVTLAPREGQGAASIQLTVASNAEPSSRRADIAVNERRVPIAQEGRPCTFTVSSRRETVEATGGNRTIQVRASAAQCAWTASSDVAWITIISGREGRGDGAVSFQVDAAGGPPRTGKLTIAGHSVQVDQGTGCSYSLGADTHSVDRSGGERQVSVSTDPGCTWSADAHVPWIAITTGSTGSGPGTVGFRVAASDGPPRTGTMTVAGRTVTIVQGDGCSVSLDPMTVNVDASGGTATINVETASGCGWSVSTETNWIALAGAANGTGRGQVRITASANIGPARTGSVVVAGHRVTVAQASGCTYEVSPPTQEVPASGGPASGAVTTSPDCGWRATSAVDWITTATPGGQGPGSVTFTVAPNDGPPRNGTVTVAGQTHSISQASMCTWSFNPPSYEPPAHQLPAAGGRGIVLVFVTGACTWTATSTVAWIRIVAGATGVGPGFLEFSVDPNTGAARTGTILVAGHRYVVRQAGQ